MDILGRAKMKNDTIPKKFTFEWDTNGRRPLAARVGLEGRLIIWFAAGTAWIYNKIYKLSIIFL